MANLAIVLFDGFAFGMLLFVLSVGLSVTLGLMGFINLAHGAFAMLGGYVAVLAVRQAGLPFLAALPLAFLAAALTSVVQWITLGSAPSTRTSRALLERSAPPNTGLLSAICVPRASASRRREVMNP